MAAPELYLIAEVADDGLGALEAALGAAPVASVLLRPSAGSALTARGVKDLVPLIQKKGAAALLADDADLVRVVRADGVHLTWSRSQPERLREARNILGERYIVGGDAGRSRDDAMTLGEEGADYVAFGIPPHVEDRDTAFERQCGLVSWWSEIFEPPCAALDAETPEAARALALAGADFVSVTIPAGSDPEAAAARVKAFAAALNDAKVGA